ncbi:MAG TPA: hypothetical protein DF383_02820 [Deltaproteobacteria bacterium]|nr:hypothetical protein [Deltaproteobacteria bacterium]
MTLSAWIRKGGLEKLATSTSATIATQDPKNASTVAKVAKVAVANTPGQENKGPFPTTGELSCFLAEDNGHQKISWPDVARMTPRDLLNGPYIFRFDGSAGRVYFTEDETLFLRLQEETKDVRWLHVLLEAWRQELIRQGLPPETSIYWWPLQEFQFWLDAFRVLPGARIVSNPLEARQ